MSEESVEVVRRIVDAIRDRRWEEATRQLGPDIELHGTAGGLTEGSVWRGPEQIRDFFEQDAEAWDERRLEAEQFIDADDCVVVLLGRLSLELLPPLTFLFGFSVLPLSWAGLALVALGVVLLILEAHFVSHGTLAVSGLIALAVGLSTLFHDAPAPYETSIPLVVSVTVVVGVLWAFAVMKAVQVRAQPVAVGPDEIVGMEGVVRDSGLVFVHGELWRARSDAPLAPGQRVRVDDVDGLTLSVHAV